MSGIGSWVTKRAFLNSDHPAFIDGDRRFTYADLDRRTNQLAHALVELGVRRGDRVAVLLANCIEFVEILAACAKLGAIMVPVNTRLAAPEAGYILADCGADVFAYHPQLAGVAHAALTEPGARVRTRITVNHDPGEGELGYDAVLGGGRPEPVGHVVTDSDVAFIMYTSGTTGRPKGAMLTHGNVLANIHNTLATRESLNQRDITVTVSPMFHIGGLLHTLPLLYLGATNIILPSFDPVGTLEAMAENRVTVQFLVAAMWVALTQVPDFDSYDLSALRSCMGGGAPCPLTMIEFLAERGIPFTEGFGLTETSPVVSILESDYVHERAGSVGRAAMHVEVRIVDDQDVDVVPGTVGELLVRGPNVFAGYWMRPQATEEACRGGWFHTGDLARADEEGFLTLVDRKKDLIITGGENVYPIEVEQVLFRHPGVLDAAVIGGADEKWGERVVAVVVADPAAAGEPSGDELIGYCRDRLAHFKCPKEVFFVSELPRNATGKLLKTELRAKFTGIQGGVVLR
ncbi:MAG TPA: long-chain fatty acid--CoA ligase [Pseudonocardia sp.]|jgi:acyl-CoA synthetase (AMP-forming)/AMP-acid ligase II|nr:long-chain fatty acid--CoA ligase [Pseudonocardia sp.]